MTCEDMAVNVTRKEKHLKEEHAGGPHGGRTTKPRKEEISKNELGPEEQKGAEENRQGKLQAGKRKSRLCGRVHRGHYRFLCTWKYPLMARSTLLLEFALRRMSAGKIAVPPMMHNQM